ncbi:MAG: radical SAM-associated putative lipoprotein [Bacteroidales bacterium]|nr:radical SAM-associated putative lipoprotein [Bacteroidales bacterium]
MKSLFSRYLLRFLTVLGCSTLVTACYGVPYAEFSADVTGEVLDADTGEPIKGISVRVTPGVTSPGNADGGLKGIRPLDDCGTLEIRTNTDGSFGVSVRSYMGAPDAVLLECVDVDGEDNGSYYSSSKIVPVKDGGSVSEVVFMERE